MTEPLQYRGRPVSDLEIVQLSGLRRWERQKTLSAKSEERLS